MNWFTYVTVTGAASIIGLFLQIRDVFPQHREVRMRWLVFALGTFVGSAIGSIQGFQVTLDLPDNPVALAALVLLFGAMTFLAYCGIGWLLSSNPATRIRFLSMLGPTFLISLLLLGINALGQIPSDARSITFDEKMELAARAEARKDHDRAVSWIERAQQTVVPDDPRQKLLLQKLDRIYEAQTDADR